MRFKVYYHDEAVPTEHGFEERSSNESNKNDILTVGREDGNTIQLDYPKVSRHHLEIHRRDDERCYLIPKSQTNRLILKSGNEPAEEVVINPDGERLFNRDKIIIPTEMSAKGDTVLSFVIECHDASQTMPLLGMEVSLRLEYGFRTERIHRITRERRISIKLATEDAWVLYNMVNLVRSTGSSCCRSGDIIREAWGSTEGLEDQDKKKLQEAICRIRRAIYSPDIQRFIKTTRDGYRLVDIDIQPE